MTPGVSNKASLLHAIADDCCTQMQMIYIKHTCDVQVYLAVPNDCPYHPDGRKRKLSAEDAVSTSVNMYVSNDEGTSFDQVHL